MSNIYDLHRAAFSRVSAFVVTDKKGARIATIAIKFPADGASRLYAYVHVLGMEMVRAHANGYGYDKRSAAVSSACGKVSAKSSHSIDVESLPENNRVEYARLVEKTEKQAAEWRLIGRDMDKGDDWTRVLEKRGFHVYQAV